MIRKYWKHIIFFELYLLVLVRCSPLDITQLFGGDKCFTLLYSSKYLINCYYAPTYCFLGNLLTKIPMKDGMSLALFLSIIPAVLSAILVFLIVRKKTDNKYAPWIGSAVLMGSWVFFSQAIKVEVYSLAAFLLILSYYLVCVKKYTLSAIILAFAISAHSMTWIGACIVIFLSNWQMIKRIWITIIISVVMYFVWVHVIPIFNKDIVMSNINAFIRIAQIGFFGGSSSQIPFFAHDAFALVVASVGIGIIPIIYLIINNWKIAVPFLFVLFIPLIYFLAGPIEQGYVQMTVAIPFISVAAGIGSVFLSYKRVILFVSMIFIFVPLLFFKVDTNPTSARSMINQLDVCPNGSLIMCVRLYNNVTDTYGNGVDILTNYYDKDTGRDLIPVEFGIVWDARYNMSEYKTNIESKGVIFPNNYSMIDKGGMWYDDMGKNIFIAMDAMKKLNPSRHIYYYEYSDLEKMICNLKEWK